MSKKKNKKTEEEFKYRVTWADNDEGEPTLNIDFGTQLPDGFSDDMKLYALSRLMNGMALRLAGSRVSDEDDYFEDED